MHTKKAWNTMEQNQRFQKVKEWKTNDWKTNENQI